MDTCTIETGLLKKKPCGQNAVTKCANCEQPLCAKHATGMMSGGRKTMLCGECAKAWKDMGEVPATPAVAPKAAAHAPAHAPAPAHKPAAPAPKPAAAPAPKPAAAAPKPAAGKPELALDKTGPLQFTPAAAAPKPAPKPAAAAPKPAVAPKPEDSGLDKKPQLSIDQTGPLEFTPSKKPDPKK